MACPPGFEAESVTVKNRAFQNTTILGLRRRMTNPPGLSCRGFRRVMTDHDRRMAMLAVYVAIFAGSFAAAELAYVAVRWLTRQ